MKQDIILAGVGGQGILSIAFVIDNAALKQGFNFKQAEVHGMAQRGGAVQSHLRISDKPVFSDLIPKGVADMILSVEPMECLRYLDFLSPEGIVITSRSPFVNIPDYPDIEKVMDAIQTVANRVIVDSDKQAKEAGSPKSQNMVMLGAASPHLILEETNLTEFIRILFAPRGDKMVEMNLKAFDLGRTAAIKC
ncbi:MAG: indolepyruvate oxidoreductase subunit beta [Candidatus Aminicenantes bacterium]|nr:MAG: indolepyruvate oxidoreductase subunit beta [Candidatus Aminicenantes bacterium]